MRAKEFISEMKKGEMQPHQRNVLNNPVTYPKQGQYGGDQYLHAQFLKALACAGAGDTPDAEMAPENWAGGDPVFIPYHDTEIEMLNRAAKYVGDNSKREWGGPSKEPKDTHKVSPVASWQGKEKNHD